MMEKRVVTSGNAWASKVGSVPCLTVAILTGTCTQKCQCSDLQLCAALRDFLVMALL